MQKSIIILLFSLLFLLPGSLLKAEIVAVREVTFGNDSLDNPFKSLLPEKKPALEIEIETVEPEVEIKAPDIKIQGIVWGGRFPQAIINESVIKEGDILPEAITILEIKPQEVVVLFKSKIFTYYP